MRLVLDTNAAVSGLLWHGNPGKLIDAAHAGSVTLYASAPLLLSCAACWNARSSPSTFKPAP